MTKLAAKLLFKIKDRVLNRGNDRSHCAADGIAIAQSVRFNELSVRLQSASPMTLEFDWGIGGGPRENTRFLTRFHFICELDRESLARWTNGCELRGDYVCHYDDGAVFVDVIEPSQRPQGPRLGGGWLFLVWLGIQKRLPEHALIRRYQSIANLSRLPVRPEIMRTLEDWKRGDVPKSVIFKAIVNELGRKVVKRRAQLVYDLANDQTPLGTWFRILGAPGYFLPNRVEVDAPGIRTFARSSPSGDFGLKLLKMSFRAPYP